MNKEFLGEVATISLREFEETSIRDAINIYGSSKKLFVVEEDTTSTFSYSGNTVSDEFFYIKEGVNFKMLSELSVNSISIRRNFYLEKAASLDTLSYIEASSKLSMDNAIYLGGESAEAYERTSLLLTGSAEARINSLVEHRAGNTEARSDVRAVQRDSSTSDINGLIRIREECQGVDSFLAQQALLLDNAMARTKPCLEIGNNDVKASHSSNIHTLDDEELFYLMSRGIAKKEAEQEVIRGFLSIEDGVNL
ncbi:MAG: SufD family Fe-S cluster assembly protein [Methanobacteriota archaeon]|nr:MAG: SufD family Fe-S cluster assembly protein [Euryarchaeota archaeon]